MLAIPLLPLKVVGTLVALMGPTEVETTLVFLLIATT
jgi:hypothetical protein